MANFLNPLHTIWTTLPKTLLIVSKYPWSLWHGVTLASNIPDYKNINLTQSVNFDPLSRQGTKSYTRKNNETDDGVLQPDTTNEKQFNKIANAFMQGTHYNLGSDKKQKVSENRGSFRNFSNRSQLECHQNNKINEYFTKDNQKGHLNFKLDKSNTFIYGDTHFRSIECSMDCLSNPVIDNEHFRRQSNASAYVRQPETKSNAAQLKKDNFKIGFMSISSF